MLYYIGMDKSDEIIEVDISDQIGYHPANISDQICGKIFPDSKVKPGTRWFYVLLSIIIIGSILISAVGTISLLF